MSGMQIRAFRPLGANKTVNTAVLATSSPLTIPDTPLGTRALRLVNVGTLVVYVELGSSTVAASAGTSTPLLPNTAEVFTIGNDVTTIAAIASGTGNTLYVTYGEGL